MSRLATLETLRIGGNPLKDMRAVVASLKSVPKLRDLSIDLHDRTEVELILEALPDVERLNGQGFLARDYRVDRHHIGEVAVGRVRPRRI